MTSDGDKINKKIKVVWNKSPFTVWVREDQGDCVPDFLLDSLSPASFSDGSWSPAPINSDETQKSGCGDNEGGIKCPDKMRNSPLGYASQVHVETQELPSPNNCVECWGIPSGFVLSFCQQASKDKEFHDGLEEGEIPTMTHQVKSIETLHEAATTRQSNGSLIGPGLIKNFLDYTSGSKWNPSVK